MFVNATALSDSFQYLSYITPLVSALLPSVSSHLPTPLMPPTDFKDRLAALGLRAVDGSSTACSCALAILKLLPQADLDDQIKEAIDAQAAHEASLKADLEKDPTAFVVSAHLAYCILCKQDVPLDAHYSKADWERHLTTCHPAAKEEDDSASEALSGLTREGPTSEPPCKCRPRESTDAQVQTTVMHPVSYEEGPTLEFKSSDAPAASVRKTPRSERFFYSSLHMLTH